MIWLYVRYSPVFSKPQCRYPMCGMHRTTVSPSSSSTSRSTPCVAGCCGPMLMSMCSPSSSGSSAGGASSASGAPLASDTISGTRRGRPWASTPVVASSTSTVRFVVAMPLLPRLLAGAEPPPHVVGELLEGVGDRQLFHGVARLGIRRERLPQLLRPAEAAAQGEVLAQREALLVLLPHQEAP